jgi:hypothetical protein
MLRLLRGSHINSRRCREGKRDIQQNPGAQLSDLAGTMMPLCQWSSALMWINELGSD